MSMYYLSKSDYMLAHACPTKLFYKKLKYPNNNDENEYMQYLARGGYMVGKLATLLYPEGIAIETGSDHNEAIKLTQEHLKKENVTLFEAAIESKGKLIRIDVLNKVGNTLQLIEVKSKSYETTDDDKKKKKLRNELEDYIIDVAYQYYVLKEAYGNCTIKPYLFLPDKAKRTKVEGLNLCFRIEENNEIRTTQFKKFNVIFDNNSIADVLHDDLMTLVDVEKKVLELQDFIKKESDLFLESLKDGLKKIEIPLSNNCFNCEFSITDETHKKSGFDECWKEYKPVEHHIKELYHIGTIGGNDGKVANQLIKDKKISLYDVPPDVLKGKRGERQTIQILFTKRNEEWCSQEINAQLNSWKYPLHFIDFETAISALPFHKGMRPYEQIAFQWSCHTIEKPGDEPKHHEWINLAHQFPNFKFADALMEHIGTDGTFLMWATHENTVLRNIYEQYSIYKHDNPKLKKWLELVVKMDKEDSGLFIDLNKFTFYNYFHPKMKGKTSIKWTLPAVIAELRSNRAENWLKNFENNLSLYKKGEDGCLINPYELLPPIEIYNKAENVADGTGAMRAYEDLMFGLNRGDKETADKYEKALLRYCKLDTLAMVIIWEHWNKL